MRLILMIAVFGMIGAPARGEGVTASDFAGCRAIADATQRLECFDGFAKDWAAPAEHVEVTTTRDIVSPTQPVEARLVDPDDLYLAPRKYLGKLIELRDVKCFYADVSEYRCAPRRGRFTLTIFAKTVAPDKERDLLESECGTIRTIDGPKCRKTIRFTLNDFGADRVSGMEQRVIAQTLSLEIVAVGTDRKSRK